MTSKLSLNCPSRGSPRPKKARQVQSNVKVMLTVFFDINGIVHYEFLPRGQTVNKEYYLQVHRRLREAIRKNARICGKTIDGFCTTIMHLLTLHCLFVNFWSKTILQRCPSLHIYQTWLRVTFSYFQK